MTIDPRAERTRWMRSHGEGDRRRDAICEVEVCGHSESDHDHEDPAYCSACYLSDSLSQNEEAYHPYRRYDP